MFTKNRKKTRNKKNRSRKITRKIIKKTDFPYYRLFKTKKEILKDFQKIKRF